jgi:hypothetical protein
MSLPAQFSDLAPLLPWALEGETARYEKRIASPMSELQDFYDLAFPRLKDGMAYLDTFDINDLPEPELNLFRIFCALMTVSFPVESWRQPRVPDSGAAQFNAVLEPVLR